jgi:hypothetical protein
MIGWKRTMNKNAFASIILLIAALYSRLSIYIELAANELKAQHRMQSKTYIQ